MKRLASLFAFLFLTSILQAEVQQPTVVAYWNFASYPGSVQSVSRVIIQGIPPFPKINGVYQIPNPVAFFPGTYPLITNGIVSTNVAVDTPLKVTFSGPFGSRSVTNFFPSILTNGAGPYNAAIYDVQAIAQFNDYIIGVWFNGTNFLGAGLAPTNLTGAQGITIGGVYPNYIVGAQGQIITNAASFAIALSNNFSASNITASANLSVGTNIASSGLTVTAGITNQFLTTNEPMFVSTGGQEISVPISTFTNGVNTALAALNSATSNAMIATNSALLVTIAAGSNSIANSMAATNTALLTTIAAGSNAIASQLSATNTAILATITAGSNAISGQLAATNTALLATIAAGSNSIANSLANTNTAILATITAGSNFFATSLAATNTALVTRITNATNSINAASLTGTAPIAVLPPATVSTLGVVRADNATITNVGGVLYAVYTNNGSVFSVSGDGVLITNTITHSGSFATVPANGFTFLGGPQGAGAGQPSYQPYSAITNALNTALTGLNTSTSNAMIATNTALLVTIAAGSNSIAGQLAATNTALLATIAAGSNSISGQLAATNTALLATIATGSNAIAGQLAATNTALLAAIATGSNSIANSLAATNTALLATILATSNAPAGALAATNAALLVTIATGSNSIANSLAATNTALLVTIAADSNAISGRLLATNTALLATISTGSNFFATSLAGTNAALVTDIINSTNTINAASLVAGPVPVGVLPVATSGALGIVRPDNSTITISGGIISGTSPPANVKTLGQQIFTNAAGQLAIKPGYQTTNPAVVGSVQFLPTGMAIGDDLSSNMAFFNPATNFYFGTSFGNTNGVIYAAIINTATGVLQFTNDTAISRKTAKVIAIGSGTPGDSSGTIYASGIVVTNSTNLSTLSAGFLGTDGTGKIIAPTNLSAAIITNVPGTNRYHDNVGRFEVDTNFNLLGTMEVNGTNASTGQVLTAINGSGGVAFGPLTAGALPPALQLLNTNNGAALTNLNGANIASGTISSARLPQTIQYATSQTLTNLNGLANSAGVLTNNGSGTLAWVPVASGGGSTDSPLPDGTTILSNNAAGTWSTATNITHASVTTTGNITNLGGFLQISNNVLPTTAFLIIGSNSSFSQSYFQNTATNTNSSMDIVIGYDNSAPASTSNYVDLFVNSSNYTGFGGGAHDAGIIVQGPANGQPDPAGGSNFRIITTSTNSVVSINVGQGTNNTTPQYVFGPTNFTASGSITASNGFFGAVVVTNSIQYRATTNNLTIANFTDGLGGTSGGAAGLTNYNPNIALTNFYSIGISNNICWSNIMGLTTNGQTVDFIIHCYPGPGSAINNYTINFAGNGVDTGPALNGVANGYPLQKGSTYHLRGVFTGTNWANTNFATWTLDQPGGLFTAYINNAVELDIGPTGLTNKNISGGNDMSISSANHLNLVGANGGFIGIPSNQGLNVQTSDAFTIGISECDLKFVASGSANRSISGCSNIIVWGTVTATNGHATLVTNFVGSLSGGWTNTNAFNCVYYCSATSGTLWMNNPTGGGNLAGTTNSQAFTTLVNQPFMLHPNWGVSLTGGTFGFETAN